MFGPGSMSFQFSNHFTEEELACLTIIVVGLRFMMQFVMSFLISV